MARRIVHQLVDDLDGSVLEVGEGETVLFSLDGVAYEIDLTDANAAEFRESFTSYIAAARRVSAGRPSRGGGGSSSADARKRRRTGQQDYGPVRAWAKDNGYTLSERGRIPASVLEAYEAAH
ncbi:Lsr2 family protein [Microbacterium sp. SS28]|uniref:histone-like nucleoid-structuring protein Lsr2 n=1 Tax=Microbacterium sp. SS28 TaxID=2919948 RepID=UPI001FAB1FE5|nr:Lsr2 family protein [Microbacterium sp. SS28]